MKISSEGRVDRRRVEMCLCTRKIGNKKAGSSHVITRTNKKFGHFLPFFGFQKFIK